MLSAVLPGAVAGAVVGGAVVAAGWGCCCAMAAPGAKAESAARQAVRDLLPISVVPFGAEPSTGPAAERGVKRDRQDDAADDHHHHDGAGRTAQPPARQ